MARSHHHAPDQQHHRLSKPSYAFPPGPHEPPHSYRAAQGKKHGAGGANWGSQDEDIREGIEVEKSGDYVQHPANGESGENEKIHISPLQSPSLADNNFEKDAAKDREVKPSA